MTEKADNSSSQNFFSGFFIGAIVSGVGFYLTMTKSGRKIAREILRRAEELGEEGRDLLEEASAKKEVKEIKKKAERKIDGIMDKLKQEVRSVKKS